MREQRLLLVSIVFGITVLVGIMAYFLLVSRTRQQMSAAKHRQVELEYRALRSQMNPHVIFNALNSIQGFFAEQDFRRGNEYLGAFGALMRQVLDQCARPTISLEEEIDTLDLYMQLEQARLHDLLQV